MLKELRLSILWREATRCLNPYFNGTCSKSWGRNSGGGHVHSYVLILILMEHAQRGRGQDRRKGHQRVLILILMEHAQRAVEQDKTYHHL